METSSEKSSKAFSTPLEICSSDGTTVVTTCKQEADIELFNTCETTVTSSSIPVVFSSGGNISVLTSKKSKLGAVEVCADMYSATTLETATTVPVVLSSEGISMDVLADVTEKSDITSASLSASLINKTAVLVETPRG